jgi:hypothetical protein
LSEAADRIFEARVTEVCDLENDRIRLRKHILPLLGDREVKSIKTADIRNVLDVAKAKGKSHKTLIHIRRVLNLIVDSLWREESIPENVVARVSVPKVPTDRRELEKPKREPGSSPDSLLVLFSCAGRI